MKEPMPVVLQPQAQPQFIMGLIPCLNRAFLDAVWQVIRPGVEELAQRSNGEFEAYRVWKEVYGGSMHLYMAYADRTGQSVDPKRFQEIFVQKLNTPHQDFAGFSIVQFLDTSAHVFAVYIMPEFRQSNLWPLGMKFIEDQIKSIGAPYISVSTGSEHRESMVRYGYMENHVTFRKKLK